MVHLLLSVFNIHSLSSGFFEKYICRCETTTGIDIDPHTAGLGWAPGAGIADCCAACSSAVWWNKGCRFYTFSKGRCWLKTNNATVVKSAGVCYHPVHLRTPWPPPLTAPNLPTSGSPHRRIRARLLHQACSGVDRSFSSNLSLGVIGGHASSMAPPAPPPPPPAPWPKSGGSGDWSSAGPWGIGDDIEAKGESGTLADACSPASKYVFKKYLKPSFFCSLSSFFFFPLSP